MNKLKQRLKILTVYILLICTLTCNSRMFELIVEAAVPDDYYDNLVIGDILEPHASYKFARLDGSGAYNECEFYFKTVTTLGHTETILPKDTSCINTFKHVSIGGNLKGERYIISKKVNGIKYFYITGDDYTFDNYTEYTEPFIELKLVGDSTNTAEDIFLYEDENHVPHYGYVFPATYDTEAVEEHTPATLHIYNDLLSRVGYGIRYYCVTPPSAANLLGWKVIDIQSEYPYVNNYDYTKCCVTLEPMYSNDYIKVNYFTKTYNTSSSYYITDTAVMSRDSVEFKDSEDLVDACFVGWDKTESDITDSMTEIDLYAQYGLFTKITNHPSDVDTVITGTATFTTSAVGEDLKYKWVIGDSLKDIADKLEITGDLVNFKIENGIYISTNQDTSSTSKATTRFNLTQKGTLSFYHNLEASDYDEGVMTIRKLDTVSNTWSVVWSKTVNGDEVVFYREAVLLEPGRYELEFNYNRSDWYYDPLSDSEFKIQKIELNQTVLSGETLSSTGSLVHFNKSNSNFVDGKSVQCVVTGTYGTAYSNIAKLNIEPGGKELLGIGALYEGDPVKVNNEYNVNDVKVVANYMDYEIGSMVTENIGSDKFTVNDKLVTQVGDNPFTVTYDGFTTDFTVPGGNIPNSLSLEVNNITTNSADVKWTEPESNGYQILHYNLYFDNNPTPIKVDDLNYSLTNLEPNTEYTVSVSAVNYFGEGPSAYATFTTLAPPTVVSLTATYPNESVFVGDEFDINRVDIKAVYSDGTSKKIKFGELSYRPLNLIISKTGWNVFTLGYGDVSTNLKIHGYDYDRIEAEYRGSYILQGSEYDKTNVKVLAYYTENFNNEVFLELQPNAWTESSLLVGKIGANDYTATFDAKPELKAHYEVTGTEIVTGISARYEGNDIHVNNDYSKDAVVITAIYSSGKHVDLDTTDWTADSTTVSAVGDNAFTATWNGMSANFNVTGYSEDRLEAVYTGVPVDVGNNYIKGDVEVTVYYTNGTYDLVPTSDWSESSLLVANKGKNEYTATYLNLTADYVVRGTGEPEVVSISAKYVGPSVNVGANYSKDDVIVTAKKDDDTERVLDVNEFTVDDLLVSKVGTNNYTATYCNLSDDYSVEGVATLTSISAVYKGNDVLVGNNYNKDDVEVKAIYSDGSTTVLSSNDWKESSLLVSQIGSNVYKASYNGLEADFDVNGYEAPKAVLLEAKYNGDPIHVGRTYNKDDVVVTLYYNNNTNKVLSSKEWSESDLFVRVDGDNKFTASYDNLSADYVVTGFSEPVTITSITAEYVGKDIRTGETYDKADVLVKVNYSDSSSKLLSSDEWTASGLSVNKVGANEFKATYNNLEDTYSVEGIVEVTGIKATYDGDDIIVGKKYAKKDVSVVASYHDGTSSKLSKSEWEASSLKVTKKGKNKFTATYGEFTDNYKVTGYVEEPVPVPQPTNTPVKPQDPPPVSSNYVPVHTGVSNNLWLIIILAFISIYSFTVFFITSSRHKSNNEDNDT